MPRKKKDTVLEPVRRELVLKIVDIDEDALDLHRRQLNNNGRICDLDTGVTLVVVPAGGKGNGYQFKFEGNPDHINETKARLQQGEPVTMVGSMATTEELARG